MAPLELLGINLIATFPDLEIYFGLNPTMDNYLLNPHLYNPDFVANIRRPHFTFKVFNPLQEARIIIPVLPPSEVTSGYYGIYLDALMSTLRHELGHYVHIKYMPNDGDGNWIKWAITFNASLDFGYKVGPGDYPHYPSHEKFANVFMENMGRGFLNYTARKFYFGLWGVRVPDIIKITIGNQTAEVNSKQVDIDQPAIIMPETGRTMVPLRFIAEALGAKVQWNKKTQEILIIKTEEDVK